MKSYAQDIKPMKGFLLVKRFEKKKKTASGIILADIEGLSHLLREQASSVCEVMKLNIETDEIKEGDFVFVNRFALEKWKDYYFIKERDILCVI